MNQNAPTESGQNEALTEICAVDAKYCHGIDMDAYARREVKAEIYAIQNYDNFGCATCALAPQPPSAPGVALSLLALTLVYARRYACRR